MGEKDTRSWQPAAPPPPLRRPPAEPPPVLPPDDEPAPDDSGPALPPDDEIIEGEVIAVPEVPEALPPPPTEEVEEDVAPPSEAVPDAPPPVTVAPAGRMEQLPKRRWRLRAPRVFINGLVGALIGGAIPFIAWWLGYLPPGALWFVLIPMVLGWAVVMPRPLYLAMDKQGVALISKGWFRTTYLWLPQERMISLAKNRGWLLAVGTVTEQEGDVDWQQLAAQAGAPLNHVMANTFSSLAAGQMLIAAPIFLLDELSRDEVELWIYQQGRF